MEAVTVRKSCPPLSKPHSHMSSGMGLLRTRGSWVQICAPHHRHLPAVGPGCLATVIPNSFPHTSALQRNQSISRKVAYSDKHLTGHHDLSKLLLTKCLHQTVLLYTCERQFPGNNCLSTLRFSVQAADHVPDLPECIRRQSEKTGERK